MDIKLLKNAIFQNSIPNLMIFVATESMLAKQYLDSMAKTLNTVCKYYDKADQVLYEVSTNLRDNYVYVIMNDESILKNTDYVLELDKFKDRNIVIYFNELDTKSDLYKSYKDICVKFDKLDKYTLLAYLMKQLDKYKIAVNQDKIEKLIDYCDCNLGCCLNELDKIITLNQANSNMLFDYMLKDGFSDFRKTNVFNFIYKIINRDFTAYDDKIRLNDSIITVITLLYKQVLQRLERDSSNENFINILKLCSLLDSGIKDGTISDKYALDYLMLKVM